MIDWPTMTDTPAVDSHRRALDALSMAVQQQLGHLGKDAALGIRLRHNHGPCFIADEFQKQTKASGLTPNYAFVGQPETNGVIERFFKTLKEQLVYGRMFQNIEEVRTAVRDFIARYSAEWLIEKNGYLSPRAMRQTWTLDQMQMAA